MPRKIGGDQRRNRGKLRKTKRHFPRNAKQRRKRSPNKKPKAPQLRPCSHSAKTMQPPRNRFATGASARRKITKMVKRVARLRQTFWRDTENNKASGRCSPKLAFAFFLPYFCAAQRAVCTPRISQRPFILPMNEYPGLSGGGLRRSSAMSRPWSGRKINLSPPVASRLS